MKFFALKDRICYSRQKSNFLRLQEAPQAKIRYSYKLQNKSNLMRMHPMGGVHENFAHPFSACAPFFLFSLFFCINFSDFAHPFLYNEGVCACSPLQRGLPMNVCSVCIFIQTCGVSIYNVCILQYKYKRRE